MDIVWFFDEGLHLNWQRQQRLTNGPAEFHLDQGDWSVHIWLSVTRESQGEWVIQAWNRTRPDQDTIDTIPDDYAGFTTASEAMRACEHWLEQRIE